MKNILFCLFLLLSTTLFSQKTDVFTQNVSGIGYANGGTYYYEATLKCQLYNAGMGDIAIKVGVFNYKITRFITKYDNTDILVENPISYPITIKNFQTKFKGSFSLNGSNIYTSEYMLDGMRQGALDNITLNKKDINRIVSRYNLRDSSKNINRIFSIEILGAKLINEYFEELSQINSMLDQKKREKDNKEYLAEQKRKAQDRLKELEAEQRIKNKKTNNFSSKNTDNTMSNAMKYYYLQQKQERERKERLRKQNIQNTANAMSGLMDMDFGYGERIGFFSLTGGFNYLWGDVDEASVSIPINASLELNIPIAKSYEIELLGDYNYNLDISSSDIEATNESYYFAGGINLGKSRKFSVLYVNHNIKYYLEIKDENHNESYIGVDEVISTNGIGISYNFNGKYMDELGRILVLYTKGKDDVSNINVRYDMSTGALMFSVEYNQFTNKFMDYSVGSIGMRFGFKLPF